MSNDFSKTRWETIQQYGNQLTKTNIGIEITQIGWNLSSPDISIPENALAIGHGLYRNYFLIDRDLCINQSKLTNMVK